MENPAWKLEADFYRLKARCDRAEYLLKQAVGPLHESEYYTLEAWIKEFLDEV